LALGGREDPLLPSWRLSMEEEPGLKRRSYARITIKMATLSLMLLVAFVARPASRMQIQLPEPSSFETRETLASTGSFHMRAKAGGLFPGARRPLRLRIRNPSRFAIKVTKVRVQIRRDLSRPRCYPRRYLRATRLREPVRVPAESMRRTRTRLEIRMKVSAPDACQHAVFPLRIRAKAVSP
jgi:hypothetical protein